MPLKSYIIALALAGLPALAVAPAAMAEDESPVYTGTLFRGMTLWPISNRGKR